MRFMHCFAASSATRKATHGNSTMLRVHMNRYEYNRQREKNPYYTQTEKLIQPALGHQNPQLE
jgi:hypothetical protein